ITCAVLDVSLKSALMAGAALWIDENAHAVASALPTPPPRTIPPTKKSKARPERDPDPQVARAPEGNPSVDEATEANSVPIDHKPEDRLSAR
ncbi:MAG TPA: hypothetical protein VH044_13100, partial [Polyangiaceae bacterium]|nr:hypothetical protein [Polyangiaceae bacterium]